VAALNNGAALSMYQNGTKQGADQTLTFTNAPTVRRWPDNNNAGDSSVLELILLKRAPTTAERQLIEGVMAWGWEGTGPATRTSLPSTHPYRSQRPRRVSGPFALTNNPATMAAIFAAESGGGGGGDGGTRRMFSISRLRG
jgi:hypothetical protein